MVGRRVAGLTHSRWILALVAGALALIGAAVVELDRRHTHGAGSPPALSWILFGLAALALFFAATNPKSLVPATSSLRGLAGAPGRRALVCFAGSVLLAASSIPLFVRLNDSDSAGEAGWGANNASWLLYLASLGCFAAGAAFWQRRERTPSSAVERGWPATLPWRIELVIVAVLSAVALALRFPALGSIPHGLWFDEAQNGLVGKGLLAHGALHSVFIAGFTQMGALYFYVLGAGLELFGNSIWILRALPALAGSLAAPLLYLLASRLYGWRVGVAAGGFLAVSAWSITFSRFGVVSMVTVCLDLAIYLCVVLALRSGSVGWYGAGGLLLGFALQGYYAAQLVPVVLLLVLLHLLLSEGRRTIARLRAGVAVFSAGAVLAFLPVATYAAQHPDTYWTRTSSVSIFSEGGGAGQAHPVLTSLRRHMLMFNYEGDANGRHNLPGSPMLDWLTAALFFSGLGLCLVRIRSWQYFLPLAWFTAALSGGVFSLLFEAPQGNRTIENSVVTALLAGIFLGEGWRVLGQGPRRRFLAPAAVAAALAAVGGAAAMNVQKYFDRQANDSRVWSEMGVAKLDAGRLLSRSSARDDVWVSDALVNEPALRFLAPRGSPIAWHGMNQFPFAGGSRDLILVVPADATTDLDLLAETYPHARFEVFRAPDGLALLTAVFISAKDVSATHGVAHRRGPDGRLRLVTVLNVESPGEYRLDWRGNRARIAVDGRTVGRRPSWLASGLHWLEIDTTGDETIRSLHFGPSRSALRPVASDLLFDPGRVWPRGLEGTYRPGTEPSGPAALARIDPQIAIEFHEPLLTAPFTVDWRGELYAPVAGRYELGTRQIDRARLAVDGKSILTNTRPNFLSLKTLRLARGWHRIRILYQGLTGYFDAYLYWVPPGKTESVVPAAYLRPFPSPPSFRPPAPTLDGSDGAPPPGRVASIVG
jgi:4-amino-4-deoxy-L-arabinose transferase-like glycosyltransferase